MVVAKTGLAKPKVFTVHSLLVPKVKSNLVQLYKGRKVNSGEPDNEECSDSAPKTSAEETIVIYTKVCLRDSPYLSHKQHKGQHK